MTRKGETRARDRIDPVVIVLPARECPTCPFYVKHLNWCRRHLEPARGRCPEERVVAGRITC
jgi:hypothetical protein